MTMNKCAHRYDNMTETEKLWQDFNNIADLAEAVYADWAASSLEYWFVTTGYELYRPQVC